MNREDIFVEKVQRTIDRVSKEKNNDIEKKIEMLSTQMAELEGSELLDEKKKKSLIEMISEERVKLLESATTGEDISKELKEGIQKVDREELIKNSKEIMKGFVWMVGKYLIGVIVTLWGAIMSLIIAWGTLAQMTGTKATIPAAIIILVKLAGWLTVIYIIGFLIYLVTGSMVAMIMVAITYVDLLDVDGFANWIKRIGLGALQGWQYVF
jgi:hypothetical protein